MKVSELHPGLELGPGAWLAVDQERIDRFADATDDHQWIHVDPERAAGGPFGGTIAHGFLTLSLLAPFTYELLPLEGGMVVNYGLGKVRFPAPVPAGSRIRAAGVVKAIDAAGEASQVEVEWTIEVEGGAKPACVATQLFRVFA